MNIGEELKGKREAKELTLENVIEETGIAKDYIEALENNDFQSFPNKVYARSFLRDYANFLCLDSHKLLLSLEEEFAKIKPVEVVEPEVSEPVELPTEKNYLGRTIGIFVVIVVLCILAYFVGKNNQAPAPAPEPVAPVETKPVEKPVEAPKPPVKTTHNITIYAHQDFWVTVKVDGKNIFNGTIAGGSNIPFEVKNTIQISGGDPSKGQINVDGKSIGIFGTPGKKFDITIQPATGTIIK